MNDFEQHSLRGFLGRLRETCPHDFIRLSKPIAPTQEPTALLRRLELRELLPVVLFEKVIGSDLPLLMNVHATRQRLALALGVEPDQLSETYQRRLNQPIEPIDVKTGPVKEIVHTGEQVGLGRLPVITPSAHTPAPYISGGIIAARDPVSGYRNLSFNRLMVCGRNRLTFHPAPGLHLHAILKSATARNEGLPVAIIIGYHPAFALGTLAKVPFGVEEYVVAGAMLQAPVPLVPCETVPLEVPANAEIILEGKVLPGVEASEGPYDEFTGYAMPAEPKPVIEVSAITHRRDAIYQDVFGGSTEHLLMGSVPKAASLRARLRGLHPEIRDVNYPVSGCGRLHAVVSVAGHHPAEVRRMMASAFSIDHFLKHLWIVDEEIDVYSDRDVLWAMSTCFQGDRDILVLDRMLGSSLDPSAQPDATAAKVGFDCTRKGPAFPPRNAIAPSVLAKMEPAHWLSDLQ